MSDRVDTKIIPPRPADLVHTPGDWTRFMTISADFRVNFSDSFTADDGEVALFQAAKGKWSPKVIALILQNCMTEIRAGTNNDFWYDQDDETLGLVHSTLVRGYSASWYRLPPGTNVSISLTNGGTAEVDCSDMQGVINGFLGQSIGTPVFAFDLSVLTTFVFHQILTRLSEDLGVAAVRRQDFLGHNNASELPVLRTMV